MPPFASTPQFSPFVMLYCPCRDEAEATKLAGMLVEQHLVACANVLPGMKSYYWWEGQLVTEHEVLLLAKTREVREREIINLIQRHHSYECPAATFVAIKDGHPEFLAWVQQETSRAVYPATSK